MRTLDPHVVLVSDNQPSLAAIRLRDGGYLVTKTTPEGACATIAALEPDAVVLDLRAFDTIRFLRECTPACPVLVVTTVPRIVPLQEGRRHIMNRTDLDSDVVTNVDKMLADSMRAAS